MVKKVGEGACVSHELDSLVFLNKVLIKYVIMGEKSYQRHNFRLYLRPRRHDVLLAKDSPLLNLRNLASLMDSDATFHSLSRLAHTVILSSLLIKKLFN